MSSRQQSRYTSTSLPLAVLYDELIRTLQNSVASSTRSTYQSGARNYVIFCSSRGLQAFPPSELNLCLFAVATAGRSISYRSIKVYLHGIQFHSLLFGYPVRFSDMRYLYYVLRGIRRIQGNSLRRQPRNPITVSHLWLMSGFLAASAFSEWDKAMWRSTILTAFFGLLRVSEFTCPGTFDSTIHLSPEDISFNHDYSIMFVKIKASKTDPFRVGVTLRLASIRNHALCPVRAMRIYLQFRSTYPGPLFIFDSGVYLSRAYLAAFLQISLPAVHNINTHSFRIGGASAALSAGASDALIRIMGRWSSDCYNRYIRLTDNSVVNFNEAMSSSLSNSTWVSDDV